MKQLGGRGILLGGFCGSGPEVFADICGCALDVVGVMSVMSVWSRAWMAVTTEYTEIENVGRQKKQRMCGMSQMES